jgi:thiamine-phosphate pyrophosphorylase
MANYSMIRQQRRAQLHGLYVITDERACGVTTPQNHERIVRAAIAGGAGIVQLRGKQTPEIQLYEVAQSLREITRQAGVLFIVNDDPRLAGKVDADGVHLGPDDAAVRQARQILGEDRLIGVSCGDEDEALAALASGADYIGAGAIFATATKLDAGAPIGLHKLRTIVQATPLPVAAIGGVELQNIASLRQHGAAMACVISAVTQQENEAKMNAATRALVEAFSRSNAQ